MSYNSRTPKQKKNTTTQIKVNVLCTRKARIQMQFRKLFLFCFFCECAKVMHMSVVHSHTQTHTHTHCSKYHCRDPFTFASYTYSRITPSKLFSPFSHIALLCVVQSLKSIPPAGLITIFN